MHMHSSSKYIMETAWWSCSSRSLLCQTGKSQTMSFYWNKQKILGTRLLGAQADQYSLVGWVHRQTISAALVMLGERAEGKHLVCLNQSAVQVFHLISVLYLPDITGDPADGFRQLHRGSSRCDGVSENRKNISGKNRCNSSAVFVKQMFPY